MKNHFKYHYYDENGVKISGIFPQNETPPEPWIRGSGRMEPEHYEKFIEALQRCVVGVPKTPEHRAAMSEAKRNVKKSRKHRINMSKAHIERIKRVKQLMAQRPELKYHEACRVESQQRKLNK